MMTRLHFILETVIPHLIKPPAFLEEMLKQNCILKVENRSISFTRRVYFYFILQVVKRMQKTEINFYFRIFIIFLNASVMTS